MPSASGFTATYKYISKLLNGYVPLPDFSDYIVNPGLGEQAGIIGSLLLSHQAY